MPERPRRARGRSRYCDPNPGRFTRPDPSGKEKNAYPYAGGDPINKVDPGGTFGFVDLFSSTDAVVDGRKRGGEPRYRDRLPVRARVLRGSHRRDVRGPRCIDPQGC
ncbi:RHS repeat-associated core domain-containing protein [Streptomyces sp. SLBN-8D4]|uniref:RHS repeat-associated core domain-containing protein n=1 Tax=Streptomyces sp. SLBN-8D4 TaxID=3377728 RepID=UPI003C7BEE3A